VPLPFSLEDLTAIVRRAGDEILQHAPLLGVEVKDDGSPLTIADRHAHQMLQRELGALLPGIPYLSEESDASSLGNRTSWRRYWLVDPIDGTKEFLKGTGEFTVNVALVDDGSVVAGVVHAPALDRTYRASLGNGAELCEGDEPFRPVRTRGFDARNPLLVASREHAGPGVRALAAAMGEKVEFTSMGSSLKFCLVAEGNADVYCRDLPTMEWDVAAAHCVLEQAGGYVFALAGPGLGPTLKYNKRSLANPPFVAVGDPSGPWREILDRAGLA
jgi:3'(2'), 5'-bisphosphate nucleotidase